MNRRGERFFFELICPYCSEPRYGESTSELQARRNCAGAMYGHIWAAHTAPPAIAPDVRLADLEQKAERFYAKDELAGVDKPMPVQLSIGI